MPHLQTLINSYNTPDKIFSPHLLCHLYYYAPYHTPGHTSDPLGGSSAVSATAAASSAEDDDDNLDELERYLNSLSAEK